jgi:hypothetical protein
MLFVGTDEMNNAAFIHQMTRHFAADQRAYYEKLDAWKRNEFLIWVLKENHLIGSSANEQVIRNKLTY